MLPLTSFSIRSVAQRHALSVLCLWAAAVGAGVVGSAHAQASVRRELAQALQQARDALQNRQPEQALTALDAVRARTDLNDTERGLTDRTLATAAMQARQFALAVSAYESLLQRPDLTEPDRQAFVQSLVNASLQLKDHARAARWALEGWRAGGAQALRFRQVRLQSLALLERHDEVLSLARDLRADAQAAPLTETEWRVLAASQLKLKDEPGYQDTLLQLIRASRDAQARRAYWADLLPRVSQRPGFNPRLELDVYRLYEATGNLEDAADYQAWAHLAMKAGFPAEAARVLAQAVQHGVVPAAAVQTLLGQARQRAAEDEQALPGLLAAARSGEDWAQLGDLLGSNQRWDEAAQAYDRALALGGLKRPEEVRLHYGRCLWGAGRTAQAQEMFKGVGGDSQAVAQLWWVLAQPTP